MEATGSPQAKAHSTSYTKDEVPDPSPEGGGRGEGKSYCIAVFVGLFFYSSIVNWHPLNVSSGCRHLALSLRASLNAFHIGRCLPDGVFLVRSFPSRRLCSGKSMGLSSRICTSPDSLCTSSIDSCCMASAAQTNCGSGPHVRSTKEGSEGKKSFLEKRPPNFSKYPWLP